MPSVDFSLYLVSDRTQTRQRELASLIVQACKAGLTAVQIREKDLTTSELLSLSQQIIRPVQEKGVHVLVNDRVDIAMSTGVDGVHLRSDSLPVGTTRTLLGPDKLIGVSAHSVEEVTQAEAEGADFVVLGPIYSTPSKVRYGPPLGMRVLEAAASACRVPIFAIGGITVERVREVRGAGAFGVAVVSSILSAENVETATRELLYKLREPIS